MSRGKEKRLTRDGNPALEVAGGVGKKEVMAKGGQGNLPAFPGLRTIWGGPIRCLPLRTDLTYFTEISVDS